MFTFPDPPLTETLRDKQQRGRGNAEGKEGEEQSRMGEREEGRLYKS